LGPNQWPPSSVRARYRYPPRHPASWLACIFVLVALTGITAYIRPAEVNSWAYVVGAENKDTFTPVSYSHCPVVHNAGCHVVTEGYLSGTGANVNWGTQVPLGQPFSVREPLWAWGTGRTLISDDASHHESSTRRRAHGGGGKRSRRRVRTGR